MKGRVLGNPRIGIKYARNEQQYPGTYDRKDGERSDRWVASSRDFLKNSEAYEHRNPPSRYLGTKETHDSRHSDQHKAGVDDNIKVQSNRDVDGNESTKKQLNRTEGKAKNEREVTRTQKFEQSQPNPTEKIQDDKMDRAEKKKDNEGEEKKDKEKRSSADDSMHSYLRSTAGGEFISLLADLSLVCEVQLSAQCGTIINPLTLSFLFFFRKNRQALLSLNF